MDASRYAVCLWPGLPELWYRGRWSGLPPAVMFAVSLNFLIIARFIYPEWLVPGLVRVACWVGFGVWVMLMVRAAGRLPSLLYPRTASQAPDAFPEARKHFLRNEWNEAEAVLSSCLEIDSRDCQSLLLLASVYRHTGRLDAAERTLDLLGRLETGDPWWLECAAERAKLSRFREANAEPQESDTGAPQDTAHEPPLDGGSGNKLDNEKISESAESPSPA
jgi:hypothetical protein